MTSRSQSVRLLCRSAAVVLLVVSAWVAAVPAQVPQGTTLDTSIAPGANFSKAAFRLWYPDGARRIRGVLVLLPGSNGDGRGSVADTVWQAFASRLDLALVGCQFTDKPHDQSFIEEYVDVRRGSGQALLDALDILARRAQHAEIATAPLLLWGMSAGGEFNYEFVAWKPERVVAFVVNKGGIYYTALAPHEARNVPGILFVGGKDLDQRTSTITGLFAVNRRGAALWALAEEPAAGHIVGRSRDVALVFFEDMLGLRLPADASGPLRPLAEKDGLLGDLKQKTFGPVPATGAPNYPTAWLPTARVARAWQAMMTEQPFEH